MEWSGEHLVTADPQAAFASLLDPAALATAIPGCKRLEEAAPGRYRIHFGGTLTHLLGSFEGEVKITSVVPGEWCELQIEGHGPAGSLHGTTRVRLSPRASQTLVQYEARLSAEGLLAMVGGRSLLATARDRAETFFAGLGVSPDPA